MPIFPSYPNYYNYYHPHYNRNYKNNEVLQTASDVSKEKENTNEENNEYNQKRSSKNNSFANINISALLNSDINTPIVEIFGIKLYLDDLIIIGLLFFLYKEDVQDEILFGILLLLLLS